MGAMRGSSSGGCHWGWGGGPPTSDHPEFRRAQKQMILDEFLSSLK